MSKLKFNLAAMLALFALMTPLFSHAEDWTFAAYQKCRIYNQMGNVSLWGTGLIGKDPFSVIYCPLVKEVANIAITYVNVAVEKRTSDPNKAVTCILVQTSADDDTYTSVTSAYTQVVGKKTLVLTAPTTLYNYSGYAGVLCTLHKDDVIYGVRYKQVN